MKQFIFILFGSLFISQFVAAQKPTKQEARQIFEQTLTSLKNSDIASFTGMWYINDKMMLHPKKHPFAEEDLKAHFEEMKIFLDTALKQNLPIDKIEISKDSYMDTISKSNDHCYIKMWFKHSPHYFKGIGYNVYLVGNNWKVVYKPDYSWITVPK